MNKRYTLKRYTPKEIPNIELRTAVNCWISSYECTNELSKKCRASFPNIWKKCPKQTKKVYDAISKEHDGNSNNSNEKENT